MVAPVEFERQGHGSTRGWIASPPHLLRALELSPNAAALLSESEATRQAVDRGCWLTNARHPSATLTYRDTERAKK